MSKENDRGAARLFQELAEGLQGATTYLEVIRAREAQVDPDLVQKAITQLERASQAHSGLRALFLGQ